MNEVEINRQRAQLITQARNMLNEEYQQQRSAQYSKWQAESNHLWISKGIMLPYPSSFGYPTDEQVVVKALQLYNAQNNIEPVESAPTPSLPATSDELPASVTARLMAVSQAVKPVALPEVAAISPWQLYADLEPIVVPTPVMAAEPVEEPQVALTPKAEVEDVEVKQELDELTEPEPLSSEEQLKQDEEQQMEEIRSNSKLRSLLAQFITTAKGLDAKAQKDEGTV